MQKTGSTAIQRTLAKNNGSGFILPHLGGKPLKPLHRDALVQLFSSRADELAAWYKGKGHELDVVPDPGEQIRQAAATAEIVILSCEATLKIFSRADLERFAAFAREIFDDVIVVGYVREPVAWSSSAFWTHVKSFPASHLPLPDVRYQRFKKLDPVFGRDKVKLGRFDPKEFPGGDVVRHFCSQLGLPSLKSVAANETISRPAVAAIYRLNRGMRPGELNLFKRIQAPIVRSFAEGSWPKFRLSPDLVRPRIDRESLEWMEERIGRSLSDGQVAQDDDVTSEADLLRIGAEALRMAKDLCPTFAPDELAMIDRQLA